MDDFVDNFEVGNSFCPQFEVSQRLKVGKKMKTKSSKFRLNENNLIINLIYRRLDNKKVILNTLPISHYVEKVRWCLDKTGMEYEEEKDIGIFWILTTGRPVPTLNIPGKMISIANSSDILRYLYGHLKACNPEKAEFLEPQNLEMEEKMDKMAHQLRTFLYYHVKKILSLNFWGWKSCFVNKTLLSLYS